MKIKILHDDNLYISLHDFFQFMCPLKKKVRELEKAVELLKKANTTWEKRYNEQIQSSARPI